MSARSTPTLLYLVSPSYSGSTLLTFLLATHPAVGTIGERYQFYGKVIRPRAKQRPEEKLCSCGAPFTDCAFWTAVRDEVAGGLPARVRRHDFTRYHYTGSRRVNWWVHKVWLRYVLAGRADAIPFPLRRRFREAGAANARVIDTVLAQRGASVYLDSSKDVRHLVYLSALGRYDVRAVHLLRDGRAQVWSTLKRFPEMGIEEACRSWAYKIRLQHELIGRWAGPTHVLRYEELCADPAAEVGRVFTFAGLDPAPASLRFRNVEHHVMGNNEMRIDGADEIVDRQEWRQRLTAGQLRTFDRLAGYTNRLLGYSC